MCQGVVVSLVKFKVGDKSKTVIMSGVGSHSELIANNLPRLKKLGYTEAKDDFLCSVESDFTKGWGKFSDAGHFVDATIGEQKKIAKEYKRVAGSVKALIAHVKKCGKIDNALLDLLSAPAQKAYDEAIATAQKAYNEAIVTALKAYDEARVTALKAYNEATATAQKAYNEARVTAQKAYNEATATAQKAYNEAIAMAWCKLFRVKANRVEQLR